jgi:hypothetical protein
MLIRSKMVSCRCILSWSSVLFLFLMFANPLSAQTGKGYVMIAVNPDDAVIRLDTTLFIQKKSHVALDTGTYILRAWAPRCQLVTDTLHVNSTRPMVFRMKLPYTAEYKAYRKEKQEYNRKMLLTRYVPWGITIGMILYFPAQYTIEKNAADDYLDDAYAHKASYESLTDAEQIDFYKKQYNQSKSDYESSIKKSDNAKNAALIAIPAAAVVSGVLYMVSRKFEKPVYEETPLLSRVSFSVLPNVTGKTTAVSCAVKF